MEKADFASQANVDYIDQLYRKYQVNPRSVPEMWRIFFSGFEMGLGRAATGTAAPRPAATAIETPDEESETQPRRPSAQVQAMVHAYRELGHFVADLDPLGERRPANALLELTEFGLSPADLDRRVGSGGFLGRTDGTLRDLLDKLRRTYCGTFAAEYTPIPDKTQRSWLEQHMEPVYNHPELPADHRREILNQLVCAQGFEEYLHTRYVGAKRFSLEGAESLIPLLNTIIEEGAALGVEQFVVGMAHRGRLNTLAHVLHKPYDMILSEFEGHLPQPDEGDGDVKYHMGYSHDRVSACGRPVHVSLSFNPSHLELVNPVVQGIVRAKQTRLGDLVRGRVAPVLVHGDAAFTGQGVVLETLALSEMPYWRTGGTIHVIINNQIGFTTTPKQGRFTPYPTDVARAIRAPVFHVNGDDPEACVHAARLAVAFRQQFHCDVLIDMWCYRRHGHNEVDEPTFTQPVMYRRIAAHPPVRDIYHARLKALGAASDGDLADMQAELRRRLDGALAVAREHPSVQSVRTLGGWWKGLTRAGDDRNTETAVDRERLARVAEGLTRVPDDFTVHPKLRKMLENRLAMGRGQMPVDWGMAEALALGTLVLEGTPIRMVGQDTQRGTFSHRHACLHDYNTGRKYFPVANLSPEQAPIIVVNSMLSELAVLGFEYGFSSADPRNLVIWEAQFGDFVNMAQPIVDQFIAAAESKWQKYSGLVLLLPHGYEGQGPEHSSAHLERFLSLCADDNMQVCVPTLPAQYFHLLRRQVLRSFRKPLILMMPKSLLRSEVSTSPLEEFAAGRFRPVIDDPAAPSPRSVRRLLLCSGKVYFTLDEARRKHGPDDVAIVRVEQLYPLPADALREVLDRYSRAERVCWVQEEPRNRGAWAFVAEHLSGLLPPGKALEYHGRAAAASPATGSFLLHQKQQQKLIGEALGLGLDKAAELAPAPTRQQVAHHAHSVPE